MKTTLQILTEGFELIRNPNHWTQGILAMGIEGEVYSDPTDPACTCWCSVGALMKVINDSDSPPIHAYKALENAAGAPLARFNDSHTHAEVLQLWEKAIEHARNSHQRS